MSKLFENYTQEQEERMNIIGQNGNEGLHYVQTTTMDKLGDPNQLKLDL